MNLSGIANEQLPLVWFASDKINPMLEPRQVMSVTVWKEEKRTLQTSTRYMEKIYYQMQLLDSAKKVQLKSRINNCLI